MQIHRGSPSRWGLYNVISMTNKRKSLKINSNMVYTYLAKPSYSHCVKLGRTDDHFSTAARVKKTVTPPTDKTVTVLALVS